MKILQRHTDVAAEASVLAMIGTFDPLSNAHFELFDVMSGAAAERGLTPLIVVLFPSPAMFVNPGSDSCFAFSALEARIALIRQRANVRFLIVRMTKRDIDAPCVEFFDLLSSRVVVRELWIGARQSLGRGRQGSYDAIAALAEARAITLQRLDARAGLFAGRSALNLASQGRLKDAIKATGNPPIWARPKSARLWLSLPIGRYLAFPITEPAFDLRVTHAPVPVEVKRSSTGARFADWPLPDVSWLLLASGPADAERRATELLADLQADLSSYRIIESS